MINADFHTHTSFSTDSKSSPESMIEAAIAKGLKTYCVTDHMDYFFPEHKDKGFTEFVFDPDLYFVPGFVSAVHFDMVLAAELLNYRLHGLHALGRGV